MRGAIPPPTQQTAAPKPAFEVVDGPDEPAEGADDRGSKTSESTPPPPPPPQSSTPEKLPEEEQEEAREERRARRRREGEPRRTGPKGTTILLAAGGGVLLLACLVAGVIGAFTTLSPSRPADYTKKTASDLMDEWERNPAAASEKYDRDGVEVTGYLREIKSNIHGQTYIEVAESPSSKAWDRSILVYVLSRKARDGLLNCRVGQPVAIKAHSAEGMEDKHPRLIAEAIRTVK